MWHSCCIAEIQKLNLTLYTPCIVLQCLYIGQLDAQILVINLQSLFSQGALHVSDCVSPSSGATLYKLYIAFGICRYHTSGRDVVITTSRPAICSLYNVAPDDGLTKFETCRAPYENKDWKLITRICASSWSIYIYMYILQKRKL